ncbi:MAG: YqgE/AlgH family protein [Gammaproteobacteria bacterium]
MTGPSTQTRGIKRMAMASILGALGLMQSVPVLGGPEPSAGSLLVASRDLDDPNFRRTVILLTSYGPDGAMGLVINRPAAILPEQVLPEIAGLSGYDGPLFFGGPVQVQSILFLVRASDPPEPSRHMVGDIYLSGSRTLLDSLTQGSAHAGHLRIFAGYAGWAPGQLDHEIRRGGWHVTEATEDIVFCDDPETVWKQVLPLPKPVIAGLGAP